MNKPKLVLLALLVVTITAHAQKPFELGGEYVRSLGRGYNNSIAGLRGESFSGKSSFSIGLTYHFSSAKSYSISKGF